MTIVTMKTMLSSLSKGPTDDTVKECEDFIGGLESCALIAHQEIGS